MVDALKIGICKLTNKKTSTGVFFLKLTTFKSDFLDSCRTLNQEINHYIAEKFNNFFVDVANELTRELPIAPDPGVLSAKCAIFGC